MCLHVAVLPLHYDVPAASAGPSLIKQVHLCSAVRRRLTKQGLQPELPIEEIDLMQALENVTTAGIYFIECACQLSTRTRGNRERQR